MKRVKFIVYFSFFEIVTLVRRMHTVACAWIGFAGCFAWFFSSFYFWSINLRRGFGARNRRNVTKVKTVRQFHLMFVTFRWQSFPSFIWSVVVGFFAPIKCIILSSFKWERNYYAASCIPTLISKLWPWPVRVAPFKRIFIKFIYLFVRLAGLPLIWRQMPTFSMPNAKCRLSCSYIKWNIFLQQSIRQSGVSDPCNGSADVQYFFFSFSVVSCNSNLYAHFCASIGAKIRNRHANRWTKLDGTATKTKSPRLEWHNEDDWLQNDIRFIHNNNATTTQTSSEPT